MKQPDEYEPPRLVVLGTVAEVTGAGGAGTIDATLMSV
jgi:hypothetical protein